MKIITPSRTHVCQVESVAELGEWIEAFETNLGVLREEIQEQRNSAGYGT
jgi:hypothetical protein